jgi:methyl-accepting chemotaxis protein
VIPPDDRPPTRMLGTAGIAVAAAITVTLTSTAAFGAPWVTLIVALPILAALAYVQLRSRADFPPGPRAEREQLAQDPAAARLDVPELVVADDIPLGTSPPESFVSEPLADARATDEAPVYADDAPVYADVAPVYADEAPVCVDAAPVYDDEPIATPLADARARAVAAELSAFSTVTQIVRAQLIGVNEETGKAALVLVEQLQRIDGGVDAILAAINESVAVSGSLVSLSQNQGSSRLAHIGERAGRESERNDEQEQAVAADSARLFSFISEIAEVAERTNILALNASIEAARAGAAGRSFAVVAREVRALSNRSTELAARIESDVHATLKAIQDRFHELLSRSESAQRQVQAELADEFATLTEHLAQLMETQDSTIQNVQRRGEEVAALVIGLLASLQFQDVTRQQVEQVVGVLRAIDQHNNDLGRFLISDNGPESVPDIRPFLEEMYGTYVMDSQRTMHAASTSAGEQGAMAAGPLIELF